MCIRDSRNDVRNLLKFGIKNAIATMGVNVKEELATLAKKKNSVTAFCDGDRGGRLLLMDLSGALGKSLTHVALAPESREVEHLEGKVVTKCLNQKETATKMVARIRNQLEKDDIPIARGGRRSTKAAAADNGARDVPDDIVEWSPLMADLKKNHALLILGDGSASDPVGASKLAAFASEVEGAQCLLFLSLIHISEPTRPY